MDRWFDELSKSLAHSTSRRQFFRISSSSFLGVLIPAGWLKSLGLNAELLPAKGGNIPQNEIGNEQAKLIFLANQEKEHFLQMAFNNSDFIKMQEALQTKGFIPNTNTTDAGHVWLQGVHTRTVVYTPHQAGNGALAHAVFGIEKDGTSWVGGVLPQNGEIKLLRVDGTVRIVEPPGTLADQDCRYLCLFICGAVCGGFCGLGCGVACLIICGFVNIWCDLLCLSVCGSACGGGCALGCGWVCDQIC
jgi:hypothetical protein